jgi:hypothetical protein
MKIVVALALASLAACGSEPTGRYSQALTAPPPGQCGEIETHVIGVYQTPHGDGTVEIDRSGKHVLILSAYEATTWHIKTAPDAELEHVYAVGYHRQAVDLSEAHGTPTVRIDSMDKNGTFACGYSWPADGGACDTDGLLELASERTSHDVNSFAGCFEASNWKIDLDMAATSDCMVSAGPLDHFFSCDSEDTSGKCGSSSGAPSGSGDDTGSDDNGVFF